MYIIHGLVGRAARHLQQVEHFRVSVQVPEKPLVMLVRLAIVTSAEPGNVLEDAG